MGLITPNDYHPFDPVTLPRIPDEYGDPTDGVEIEGLRQVGKKTRNLPYVRLLEQAGMY